MALKSLSCQLGSVINSQFNFESKNFLTYEFGSIPALWHHPLPVEVGYFRSMGLKYCLFWTKIKYDFDLEFMSDKNGGADDFMAEMAQFLKPGDFQRPSDGDSKKLKLKKPKKDKKEKKVKLYLTYT